MSDQQAELDGVQKKYRIVEGNAKAYSGESQSILAKQRGTIEKLKGDNQQLKEELSLQRKHAKLYDNVSAQAQIAKLQDTGDTYTRKIELEKRRIEVRRVLELARKPLLERTPLLVPSAAPLLQLGLGVDMHMHM